jgi:hypothetical protein
MLLYRSFVVGLLGACCLLLAARPDPEVRIVEAAPPTHEAATIVDVSAAIGPDALADLLHVPPGAQVIASGPGWTYSDASVAGSPGLEPILADHMLQPGSFLDLTVNGRRVLVLVH